MLQIPLILTILILTLVCLVVKYLRQYEISTLFSFFYLLFHFRGKNLVEFVKEHERLFREAKESNDFSKVTFHFYQIMAQVIEMSYGAAFHFAPKFHHNQSNSEAIKSLHYKFSNFLNLHAGKECLEIGCGIGGSSRDIAFHSGCKVTGLTLSREEVNENNALNAQYKLDPLCHAYEGDMRKIPFEDDRFDACIAIYTLKYVPKLEEVMKEVSRVLKPGGKFLVYCLMKSEGYNDHNEKHKKLISRIEYSCGMPPLHTVAEVIESAQKESMKIRSKMDLSTDAVASWYSVFSDNTPLMWALNPHNLIIASITTIAQYFSILPSGFDAFMNLFIRGNVLSIVKAGRMGILSGSEVLIFEKQ